MGEKRTNDCLVLKQIRLTETEWFPIFEFLVMKIWSFFLKVEKTSLMQTDSRTSYNYGFLILIWQSVLKGILPLWWVRGATRNRHNCLYSFRPLFHDGESREAGYHHWKSGQHILAVKKRTISFAGLVLIFTICSTDKKNSSGIIWMKHIIADWVRPQKTGLNFFWAKILTYLVFVIFRYVFRFQLPKCDPMVWITLLELWSLLGIWTYQR